MKMRNTIPIATLVFGLIANAALCQGTHSDNTVRTDEFQLTLTFAEVVGADSARAVEAIIAPHESITWEFYVPDSYRPGNPAGLMVYISPSASGKIPRRWKSVMDKHNIIWVAANRPGKSTGSM